MPALLAALSATASSMIGAAGMAAKAPNGGETRAGIRVPHAMQAINIIWSRSPSLWSIWASILTGNLGVLVGPAGIEPRDRRGLRALVATQHNSQGAHSAKNVAINEAFLSFDLRDGSGGLFVRNHDGGHTIQHGSMVGNIVWGQGNK